MRFCLEVQNLFLIFAAKSQYIGIMTQQEMKQKYAVVILFALIFASGLTSFESYQATEKVVAEDMTSALTKALAEQQSDVISSDTIRVFNSYLKMEQLRGHAVLAVEC